MPGVNFPGKVSSAVLSSSPRQTHIGIGAGGKHD